MKRGWKHQLPYVFRYFFGLPVATNTSMKRGWKQLIPYVVVYFSQSRVATNTSMKRGWKLEVAEQGKLYESAVLLQQYLKRMWNGVDLLIYDSYGSTSRWLRHP
jgi:hypothetical protein